MIVATNNLHKLEEIRAILGNSITLQSLADIGCTDDIPETADTFQGNALMKARYIYLRCFRMLRQQHNLQHLRCMGKLSHSSNCHSKR